MKAILAAASAAILASASAMANNLDPNNPSGNVVDRFADIEVLRYTVPGFNELSPKQKLLVYYLTEAALQGRDILWDQNGRYNLQLRRTLEGLYQNYKGDRSSAEFLAFEKYLKQVEFGNGPHHHYSADKFTPGFSSKWFESALAEAGLPKPSAEVSRLIFDPAFMAKRTNQAAGEDLILTSANNLYGPGVSQPEVEAYYAAVKDTTDLTPISYGLNSRLEKGADGKLFENAYKVGGLYSAAIERIVDNLRKALPYAESESQAAVIRELIKFYETGDLATLDRKSVV